MNYEDKHKDKKSSYLFIHDFNCWFSCRYSLLIQTNSDIYIKTIEINFPDYPPSRYETSVSFRIMMLNEIWNPNNRELEIGTAHSNLFDPTVTIEWVEDEYIYHVSYFALFVCTVHKLAPGISGIVSYVDLIIENYNKTAPPDGEYTFRNEIDGFSEEYYTFGVCVYNTIVEFENNQSSMVFQSTPVNWGETTLFPLTWKTSILLVATVIEVVLIATLIYSKYYNKIKEKGE